MSDELFQKAAELIRGSRKTVALTGAGVSTPSGIPDFRSPGSGLWETIDPIEVATIDAFRENPAKFYKFMGPLAELALNAEYHAGKMGKECPSAFRRHTEYRQSTTESRLLERTRIARQRHERLLRQVSKEIHRLGYQRQIEVEQSPILRLR